MSKGDRSTSSSPQPQVEKFEKQNKVVLSYNSNYKINIHSP